MCIGQSVEAIYLVNVYKEIHLNHADLTKAIRLRYFSTIFLYKQQLSYWVIDTYLQIQFCSLFFLKIYLNQLGNS